MTPPVLASTALKLHVYFALYYFLFFCSLNFVFMPVLVLLRASISCHIKCYCKYINWPWLTVACMSHLSPSSGFFLLPEVLYFLWIWLHPLEIDYGARPIISKDEVIPWGRGRVGKYMSITLTVPNLKHPWASAFTAYCFPWVNFSLGLSTRYRIHHQ